MDIETVQTLLIKVAIFAPLTTGIVQAIKASGFVSDRFLPLAALVVGAGFGWYFVAASALGILAGLALGLAAVGLFEFGKTTVVGK